MKATLIVRNIGQLVTMNGPAPRIGRDLKEAGIIQGAAVAADGEKVIAAGASADVMRSLQSDRDCIEIDARGGLVTPGLIDPHTHPVFSATREDEFEMRLQGRSYMEIAQAGGGIRRTVRDLRSTPRELLKEKTRLRLNRFLEHGVTTIEAKSGYGLSLESEVKQLEIIRELNSEHAVDLVPTFLGAHEFPDEYRDNREEYVSKIIEEMLPLVTKSGLAEFSDIFCEEGVFDYDQSRRIQDSARSLGLGTKFHADELVEGTKGAELAASLGAISADHLVYVSDEGIRALAKAGTVAVLLPGTTFSLGSTRYAPARRMIEEGVPVALATDCNPGSSYCESLTMMMSLAAVHLKMTAAETIAAVTVNAACAIARERNLGSLSIGKQADLVIWEAEDLRELPYHYGVNLVSKVIKKGKVVVDRTIQGTSPT